MCELPYDGVVGVHVFTENGQWACCSVGRTMAVNLRGFTRWSEAPARDVETATTSKVNVLRGLAARATTPLLPDDYLKLLNPLWSARELRGEVVGVRRETEDSATVTIKPGWGFSADYRPGQYVGIGLRIDGRWYWRSYSLTSVPRRDKKLISITVKATPEGFLSTHLVNGVNPGRSCAWPHPGRLRASRSATWQAVARHGGQRHHSRDGDAPVDGATWPDLRRRAHPLCAVSGRCDLSR